MGIPCVKAALRRLHGVKPTPAAFLHHDRFDQLHIFGDTVLRGILPDQRFVGFHLGADRGIGITAAPAAEQGNRTAQQHNDQDNHHGNPAPGHQNGDQRLCTGDDRLNC